MRLALAIAIGLGASACSHDEDPLGREAIAELARSRGTAQGGARSGLWNLRLVEQECTCPADAGGMLVLCGADETLGFIPVNMRAVEGDGVITLAPDVTSGLNFGLPAELSGPIDADGSFAVGFVTLGLSLNAELDVTSRLDAEMDGTDAFTGEMQTRLHGSFGDASVDCGSRHDVEAERL